MAQAFPDTTNIEEISKYRPGVASRIANLLTGGIFGNVSGISEKSQEAEQARRVLLQEEFQNRAMKRRRMEELLQGAQEAGIPSNEASDLMADPARLANRIRDLKMREQIAGVIGQQMGITGEQGPVQFQSPVEGQAFRLGQATGSLAQFRDERERQKATEEAIQTARALGIQIPAGATPEAIRALVAQQSATAAQTAAASLREKSAEDEAKAYLEAVGEEVPTSGKAAIARVTQIREGAPTRTQRTQQENLERFFGETDPQRKKELFSALTPSQQKLPNVRQFAGVKDKAPKDVEKEINSLADRYAKANIAASSIAAISGASDISDISQKNFNELRQIVYGKQASILGETAEREKIRRVIQNIEGLVAGTRKDLFGASLTGNELASARSMFGDPNRANFLQSALDFIDSVFSQNKIGDYSEIYDIPEARIKKYENELNKWKKTSGSIKGWKSQFSDELSQSQGVTNAPASGRLGTGKTFRIVPKSEK